MNTHFLEPLDVLFLRGNRLFGDAGSYGESMVPPWPSAAAGAIRSAILVRDGVDLSAFAEGKAPHRTLGTPDQPGTFRITDFQLAWHGESGDGPLERLYPLPADLVATKSDTGEVSLHSLKPQEPYPDIECSIPSHHLPVLAQEKPAKPATGLWLTEAGFQRWLAGETPDAKTELVEAQKLWKTDERVGIGLETAGRRVEEGKLFTAQAVALNAGVGFSVITDGDSLPPGTLLRFGGDGRAALVRDAESGGLHPDLEDIVSTGRCRIVLTAPGIFPDGWRLPGMAADGTFELWGIRGRIVAAAVPRAEVISGWDLARWRPKPANRAAPAGSVYWIEDLEATPEQLGRLAEHGLWPETGNDAQRRAEGFNRFQWGRW